MTNELIAGRRIADIGAAHGEPHAIVDEHHSPQDWQAYFHALEHKSVFERRFHEPPRDEEGHGEPGLSG